MLAVIVTWAIFGMLSLLTLASAAMDIQNHVRYDGEGISRATLWLATLWTLSGMFVNFLEIIDPLM